MIDLQLKHMGNCLAVAILTLSLPLGARAFEVPENPNRSITEETLSNGLHVVYAPSEQANTFRFKAIVRVGQAAETESTSGISHLLEHYLFTDAKLEKDMSYLEVIREKGGSANGQTSEMLTTYFATVPGKESEWLTRLFYKMLFHRTFNAKDLEQVKKPVLLEIGQPGPFDRIAKSWIVKVLSPEALREPDFWESEFANHREHFSHAFESYNTIDFKVDQVEHHYTNYYHPGNMTILLAGKFDVAAAKQLIATTFGSVADWPAYSLKENTIKPRDLPYVRSNASMGTPYIAVGTKLSDMSPEDELTARVYGEYLSHRWMKEIRNKQGNTYTVRPIFSFRERFGAAYLSMEAPAEHYSEILSFVRGTLDSEATQGHLTSAQFDEAMNLYSSHFKLKDHDSGALLDLAEHLDSRMRIYGKKTTEFDTFKTMQFEDFRARLQKLYSPKHAYSYLSEPPLIGRLEEVVLILASIALFFALARRVFGSHFEHSQVRWIRKFAHPPVFIAEWCTMWIGFLAASYVWQGFHLLVLKSNFIQSRFVLSEYTTGFISCWILFSGYLAACSLLFRKTLIARDTLYLKSMTYTSKKIALSEIESVALASPFRVLFSFRTLFQVKWRFQYLNPCFWQPGTLLRLKSGKAYFLGIRRSELAVQELNHFLNPPIDLQKVA